MSDYFLTMDKKAFNFFIIILLQFIVIKPKSDDSSRLILLEHPNWFLNSLLISFTFLELFLVGRIMSFIVRLL